MKAMREIDPYVSLPYSIPWVYGTQPERASIWDHFGSYGNHTNGHCVSNGFYPDNMYPCVKREWSPRGTIYPWSTPEFITRMIQTANTYSQLVSFVLGIHFQYPVLIGGNAGHYSGRGGNYE